MEARTGITIDSDRDVFARTWQLPSMARRVLSAMVVVLLFGYVQPGLKAQNTVSFQYCNAAFLGGELGCQLSDNPTDCAWIQSIYQTCVANANSLPPPPPSPPSPSTPCSPPILLEARPATMVGKMTMSPRDQSSSSVPCIVLVDPVIALQNQAGTGVVQNPQTLATSGALVTGAAADSATRVVVRVYANSPGDQLTVSLQPPQGDTLGPPFGTLQTILPADGGQSSSSQVTVTAVNTSVGPMGFVLYLPPQDFSRGGSDNGAPSRSVTIAAMSSATGFNSTASITIWRPPVVLVHGIWGDSWDWNNFTPFVASTTGTPGDSRFNDSQYKVHRAKYNYPAGSVSNVNPSYLFLQSGITTNSLGFAFNAPGVLLDIQQAIQDFRQLKQAAATQADVVAHSMGGTVVRTLEYLSGYTDRTSFGLGNVHKLITIGTPHLGTPLAGQLLQDTCVRGIFATQGKFAITSLNVNGQPANGGVGDSQGDGLNWNSLSPALRDIQADNPIPHEVPTFPIGAYLITGTGPSSNTGGLNSSSTASHLRAACFLFGSTLAASFTPSGWDDVFAGENNDALIPLTSQLNGANSTYYVSGVIHAAALEDLGFTGPGELDQSSTSMIQMFVTDVLNAKLTDDRFSLLP